MISRISMMIQKKSSSLQSKASLSNSNKKKESIMDRTVVGKDITETTALEIKLVQLVKLMIWLLEVYP